MSIKVIMHIRNTCYVVNACIFSEKDFLWSVIAKNNNNNCCSTHECLHSMIEQKETFSLLIYHLCHKSNIVLKCMFYALRYEVTVSAKIDFSIKLIYKNDKNDKAV